MDTEKNLILLKDKDKTQEIESLNFEDGKCMVRYYNNSKLYTFNEKNVVWLKTPRIVDSTKQIVYSNNERILNINQILDFGSYFKLVFRNGNAKVYLSSDIMIEQSCLTNKKANDCFDYLKKMANNIGEESNEEDSFLGKEYNKISTISPRSVLSTYLQRKDLTRKENQTQVIYPFGFNESQKAATENAMIEQLSVIQGPPGTGKTQTILNIIANALLNNKTVAIVSNNNSATANVLEKLQKYELDFIAAYLGNKENKENFFAHQNTTYPDMNDWELEESKYQSILESLNELQQELSKMLEFKNEQALLKQELSAFRTEYEYFADYYANSTFQHVQINSVFQLSAEKILKILIKYEQRIKRNNFKLRDKIYNLIVFGIYNFNLYKHPPEEIISSLQKAYYDQKFNELTNKVEQLENSLENYDFDNAMKQYSEDSMKIFKAFLTKKYYPGNKRTAFKEDALRKNFGEFIKEYPVILSTTHSLRNCVSKNYLFDYVLIDEASQVDIVTGALAFSCAKNVVTVGDLMQLPNVIPKEEKEKATKIFQSYELNPAYDYAEHSLLSSVVTLYEEVPKTLLREHYRCHPKIINYCNQKFYNNELILLTDERESENPMLLYKTVKGNHARGRWNQRQIDVIFNEVIPQQKFYNNEHSLGIVSPFRPQVQELQKAGELENAEIDTVHKFQGREMDNIILSTVSNDINVNDFADTSNLINVAVSRAVDKLVVVVADDCENWHGTNIGDLVRYIKYNNFDIIESEIRSVFDLLYSSYSKELLKFMNNNKQISEHMSENLMSAVIEKVLNEVEFRSFDFVLHHPLRLLIKDSAKLTEDETKFVSNELTHTDFLIFNKMDKMPVLVVEVDGHRFHEDNSDQLKRDKMKDKILEKYGIPIVRMKTTGSEEETVLRHKLMEQLNVNAS
ncbi:superfamily I DNA and/or RNA helicase [Salibacterium salarium]|uniref:AAA domain-containing protein n=1 Tax=Salibacterium salarium TaxID=284579 RepID=UPI002783436A|nr:AAA domain-containing protein [Salibacterium salarium]MDQ0300548.1 superfamily I DNA and/or RNA helicase [Salibacterium salarium]